MHNQIINNAPRIRTNVLGDRHIIGYSTGGAVFESIVAPYKHYVGLDKFGIITNELITVYCFMLN